MTELREFQKEGLRQIYQFRGKVLLADEMGLGKTIQALSWIRRIPNHRPVVVVTPASLKYVWQAEAALHFGMRTEVLEGHAKKGSHLPGDVIILNYEILKSWLPLLLAAKPRCVILDEIHYVKSKGAQRTKASAILVKDVPSRLGLSGTPLTNRPIELWSVLRMIRPDIFPDEMKYAWRYCKPRYTPWGWTFDGADHLPELHRILREQCMIRRLKKDVLKELPDKTRRVIPVRLDSIVEYQKAANDFLGWLKAISPAAAMRAKKSQALVKIGYLLRLVAKLKLEQTGRWIEEFFVNHPGEKLVAFTMWTVVIDALKARFPDAVIVDGRVTGRLRQESIRKFQSNKKVCLLLGNWKAAGVGLTMTAAANCAALDVPWTPGDLVQGEDRLHRIGQKKKVIIHYLMAMDTIEEKQIKILMKKSSILDAVLNGQTEEADLDVFKELIRELTRK